MILISALNRKSQMMKIVVIQLATVKKLKDYVLMLQDENDMVDTCLTNVNLVQEMMGDKPIQAQRAINFLNSQSKMQLQFARI